MKKIIITAIVFLVIGLVIGRYVLNTDSITTKKDERKILYYRNPMDPTQTSPTPKKAPDGMDYVPVYADEETKSEQKKIAYYVDPMHPWYTSDKPGIAPDCGMELVPVYEGESDVRGIKIDPVVVQNIGVRVEEVKKQILNKTIRTTGKIDYDETKVKTVTTKIMGWVEKLYVDYTGKYVKKGEPLFEIYSPELVSTQEEYLQAINYLKKVSSSNSPEVIDAALQLVNSAKRRLLYWDIPESDIQEIEKNNSPRKTLTIYSPVSGIVIEKMVYQGQQIMAGMDLFKIADLSTVWIVSDIYQMDLPWIKLGQKVELELSYLPGKTYQGKVTYIYPFLNDETKTVKIRSEVKNTSSYDFKPGMFATVKIVSPISINAIVVPEQAIIRSGERNIAIISLGGGYFEPREVKLGVTSDGFVQILEGIKEGEKIVVSSQFLIDSESNLKAAITQMSGHKGMEMNKPAEQHIHSENQNDKTTRIDQDNKSREIKSTKVDDHKYHEMENAKHKESPIIRKGIIDLNSIDKNKDGKLFQDLMDWNVISDDPGECPLCGMTLKELPIEKVRENLIKHGFKVK